MARPSAIKTNSAASSAPRIFDEELWFGTDDFDAAQQAAADSMAATAGRVLGAKPLPQSTLKLAELAGDDSTTVQQFVDVLEQDPALSAKLLRMVNSAGFSLRQRCTSVRHAVTILGSKRLFQIASTAAVLDLFDAETGYAVQVLEHSSVMGAFCRYLGAHLGLATEELFTIGSLHDIGKLMLLDTFGEQYQNLMDRSGGEADTLHALERAEFGYDHAVLAAHVLKAWTIPDPVPKIVAWHHAPARAYRSSTSHAALVQTVRLADVLVHALATGADAADVPRLAAHEAANYLDISEAQLVALWPELVELRLHTLEGTVPETGDAPPRTGSTARLKASSRRPAAPATVPKQFPCIECQRASFGSTCPACKGELCPAHPVGPEGWCVVCARDYPGFKAATAGEERRRSLLGALLIAVLCAAFGLSLQGLGVVPRLVLVLLIAAFAAFVAWLGARSYSRTTFRRSRPNHAAQSPRS